MTEKDLMQLILIIAFVGVGILLVRWIRNKIKAKIMDQSMPDPVDEEDVIINDIVSASHKEVSGQKTIPIYRFENAVEVMAIKEVLEENNISCIVTSFEDLAYDGVYQAQKGWGVLKVFESDSEKADELIKDYLAEQVKDKPEFPETGNMPPETDQKFISNFIYKAVAALLVGALIGGLLYALWYLMRL